MATVTHESPALYYLCYDGRGNVSGPVYRVVHETAKFVWYQERAKYGVWEATVKQKARDNIWPNMRREAAEVEAEMNIQAARNADVRSDERASRLLLDQLKAELTRYSPCAHASEEDVTRARRLHAALRAALDEYTAD